MRPRVTPPAAAGAVGGLVLCVAAAGHAGGLCAAGRSRCGPRGRAHAGAGGLASLALGIAAAGAGAPAVRRAGRVCRAGRLAVQPRHAGAGRAVLHGAGLLRDAADDGGGARRAGGSASASCTPSAACSTASSWAGAGAGLAPRRRRRSVDGLLLDAGRRGLARLIRPPAVTRWLPKTLTFLTVARWLPLFENDTIFTTRGPGMRSSRRPWRLRGIGSPQHQQLADVLHGAAPSCSASEASMPRARGAVVGEHAHLDQPCAFSALSAPSARRRQAVAADHHHRVQVVGVRAVFLALGRCQCEGGHPRIIGPP
jgi:hypothetical protein